MRTAGTHDDEAGSSRPKRNYQTKSVEEDMLQRVHHEFFLWATCNRDAKAKQLMRCWRLRYTRCENKRRYSLLKLEEMHLTSENLFIPSCVRSSILPMNLIKRFLDATTLRELIGSNGRLIALDTVPGVSRVAMPRPPRLTMQDLYDRMGNMESHQGVLEKMSHRQTYNSDRYVGVFEYMAGQYNIPLQGAYAPPGYDEEKQQVE
nr:hypothetical protein [Tanacetum cinerariifolium]